MIRQAKVEDASAIAAVHVRTWQAAYEGIVPAEYLAGLSEPEKTAFWEQQLAVNRGVNLVAVNRGRVVGWVSGGPSRDADLEGGSEVYAIYVSKEAWGQGVGRRLMKRIEKAISPCSSITLWVLRQNERAIGFYRGVGYEFDGAEKTVRFGDVALIEGRLRKMHASRRKTSRCAQSFNCAELREAPEGQQLPPKQAPTSPGRSGRRRCQGP
jgi:ribosomal protein S18 acetylase RimI-like enzyme